MTKAASLTLSCRAPRFWTLLAALLTALTSASTALATDRYVNSGASCPGSGTQASPYCSFSSINSLDLAPGDRVLLARGATFNVSSGPSLILGDEDDGSSVSWNSVEPYGSGADPIISGATTAGTTGIVGTNLDYWKFIEIELKSASVGFDIGYTTLTHTGLRFDRLYLHDMLNTGPWTGLGVNVSSKAVNQATTATTSASSTATGYCACRVNDGVSNDWSGWSSAGWTMPEWVQLDWASAKTVSQVVLVTTAGYETRDFQIQYWNGSSWVTPTGASITGNTSKTRAVSFTAVSTTKIRAYITLGDALSGFARVDELAVYDMSTVPKPTTSQWVLKDIQFTDSEFAYLWGSGIDGVYSTKLETFQDILFLRHYSHDLTGGAAGLRYTKNVKWIDNRNERNSSSAAPFGNTDLHLWAVQDSTFVNSIFDYTYDAGVTDEMFVDIAYRLDQTRFRNNLFEDAAGPGLVWSTWRTVDDYGLDPTLNYLTTQEASGNVFRNNGWDTTPNANVFEGSMSINDAGELNACYTLPSGTVSDNLYWEPTGFLATNGCSHSLSETNNRSIGMISSIHHAGWAFNEASCAVSTWTAESSTNGTSWTAMTTLNTVNPRTDVRCQPSSGSVPWVNRFEQFPNTGTSYTVARTWTAPSTGTVSIRSRALKAELGGGGVTVRVTKNATAIIGPTALGASDQVGVVLNADNVSVTAGDKIRFEVDDGADNTSDRISWSPAVAYTSGGNLAPTATTSASSTATGYCACRINDGIHLGFYGWASGASLPQWVQLEWTTSQTVGRVEFYTSPGYETSEFQIQYWNGSSWVTPTGASITGNTLGHVTVSFTAVSTTKIRAYVTYGKPIVDPNTARVDELEVYSSPNLALSASPTTSSTDTTNGYCECRVNDGSTADWSGWASAFMTMPQWLQLTWATSQTVGRVEFYTTAGYETRDFQIQHWNGSSWVTDATITGNTLKHRTISFTAVSTTQLRVYVTLGDAASGFARVDELEAYQS